jgi:hypothetical protein
MKRHYEAGYDWRNAPIDGDAMYDAGGGKAHGRLEELRFDVSLKCILHLLNFEGMRCLTA